MRHPIDRIGSPAKRLEEVAAIPAATAFAVLVEGGQLVSHHQQTAVIAIQRDLNSLPSLCSRSGHVDASAGRVPPHLRA